MLFQAEKTVVGAGNAQLSKVFGPDEKTEAAVSAQVCPVAVAAASARFSR